MKVYVVYEYDEFDGGAGIVKAFSNKEKAKEFEKELYAKLYTKFPAYSSTIYDIEEVEVEE